MTGPRRCKTMGRPRRPRRSERPGAGEWLPEPARSPSPASGTARSGAGFLRGLHHLDLLRSRFRTVHARSPGPDQRRRRSHPWLHGHGYQSWWDWPMSPGAGGQPGHFQTPGRRGDCGAAPSRFNNLAFQTAAAGSAGAETGAGQGQARAPPRRTSTFHLAAKPLVVK